MVQAGPAPGFSFVKERAATLDPGAVFPIVPNLCLEFASVKGIVFTEFLEMVEARYSPALVEDLIDAADVPSKCVYTAVGTYPPTEMFSLVTALSAKTGVPIPALLKLFGEYLFSSFELKYSKFFEESKTAFDFLAAVETYIHKEVIKLYPDAELPSFAVEVHGPAFFSMIYTSKRPLADLCEGLMIGCLKHFNETAEIVREDLQSGAQTRVRFKIRKFGA